MTNTTDPLPVLALGQRRSPASNWTGFSTENTHIHIHPSLRKLFYTKDFKTEKADFIFDCRIDRLMGVRKSNLRFSFQMK